VRGITEYRDIEFYGEGFLQVSVFNSDLVKKYAVDRMQAHSETSVGGKMK
jgi:hypothetical protein